MLLRRVVVCVTALMLGWAAVPVVNAADPIDAIPDSAAVVVRFKTPQATMQKITTFATQVSPQAAPLAFQLSVGMGVAISNPTMGGVDQMSDWWLAVFPHQQTKPGVVFVIPTTDADALKQAVGEQFEYLDYKSWVCYSDDADALAEMKKRIAGEGKSVAAAIDKASQGVFDNGDLSAFVNVGFFTRQYATELAQADEQIDALMEQISQSVPPGAVPGFNMEPIWDMYGNMLHGLLQGVRDSTGFTAALAIDRNAIGIEEYLHVKAGSQTDKFFQSASPSALALMNKLPEGALGYFGAHADMQSLMKWGMEFTTGMLEGNEEAQKTIKEALDEFAKIEYGDYAGSFSLGDVSEGALRAAILMEAKPAAKLSELGMKMAKAMEGFSFPGMKQTYEFKKGAEKYGKYSADIMTMKQEIDPSLDPLGIQQAMSDVLYGPDGMTTRSITTDGLVIQTIGGGRTEMEKLLETVENPSDSLAEVRKAFPAKANLLLLIDLPRLTQQALIAAAESEKLPIDATVVKGLTVEKSYLGFAIATETQGLRLKTQVPSGQIKGFVTLVSVFQQLAEQFMNQPQF